MKEQTLEKIQITPEVLKTDFDSSIFENIKFSLKPFIDHKEVAERLVGKNPYLITVIIENLKYNLWRKKKYAKQTKIEISPKYIELLYRHFFEEYGEGEGNQIYAGFLKKYRSLWEKEGKRREIDDYIIKNELETRYKNKILKRYKNIKKLKATRCRIERERYYHLPPPLSRIDWRNPYDNIFVWYENGQKFSRRGGSGSSGQRETNSKFIFGFSLINKVCSIPTYLFIYSDENKLFFVKRFHSLCVAAYDIGSNYYLPNNEEKKVLKKTKFLRWDSLSKVERVVISRTLS